MSEDNKEVTKKDEEKSVASESDSSCCYVVDRCGCFVDPCCYSPSYACCC